MANPSIIGIVSTYTNNGLSVENILCNGHIVLVSVEEHSSGWFFVLES